VQKISIYRFLDRRKYPLALVITCALLASCSGIEPTLNQPELDGNATIEPYNIDRHQRSIHVFEPIDLESDLAKRRLDRKADSLLVVIDTSESMNDPYRGISRREYAFELLERFNRTLPSSPLYGGVILVDDAVLSNSTVSAKQIQEWKSNPPLYNRAVTADGVERSAMMTMDNRDLAVALQNVGQIATALPGSTVIILISRWENIDEEIENSIERMRLGAPVGTQSTFAGRVDTSERSDSELCVYSVGVGNWMSRVRFDQQNQCGFSSSADKIVQPRDMAQFIRRVLYTMPRDSDNDGIYDYQDQCPDTQPGRRVDFDGCLLFKDEVK